MKLGRNELCHCGSKRKYKKCHLDSDRSGQAPPSSIIDAIAHFQSEELKEKKLESVGYYLPHIQTIHQGKRVRAVGSRVYHSLPIEQTFHEFLIGILVSTVGAKWIKAGLTEAEADRHFVVQCYGRFSGWKQANANRENQHGVHWGAIPDGWARSLIALAFDLYCLQHRAELPPTLLNRLRTRDQYQGARYEIAIAAVFTRLGFEIEFLDKKTKSGRHCEFIARHEEKGIEIGVEVKSRHRRGVLHFKGTPNEKELVKGDVRGLLETAAGQNPGDIPFMIFVDMNVPRTTGLGFPDKPWFEDLKNSVDVFKEGTEFEPEEVSAIVVTNYPFHYDAGGNADVGEFLYVIPRFAKYPLDPELLRLLETALASYGNVPNLE